MCFSRTSNAIQTPEKKSRNFNLELRVVEFYTGTAQACFLLSENSGLFVSSYVWHVIAKTLHRKAADSIPFKCKQTAYRFPFVQHRLIAPVNLYFKNISSFQFNTLNSKYSSIAKINSRLAPAADSSTCLSRTSQISNGISLV